DTLDYSGDGWNAGSKLIIAARGPVIRELSGELPKDLSLPSCCSNIHIIMPGIIAVSFIRFTNDDLAQKEIAELTQYLESQSLDSWPLWILTEDSKWMSAHLNNFLWAAFTRSNPAKDVYGVKSRFVNKHWTCQCPLIIDARIKSHHAPVLETDPAVSKKVDLLFTRGGTLHGKVKGL
ncbi:MAG: 3-octaprenyl-4-hydroxybenzoate carboxy-lyase, partial [Saprospiraceae bacterium]